MSQPGAAITPRETSLGTKPTGCQRWQGGKSLPSPQARGAELPARPSPPAFSLQHVQAEVRLETSLRSLHLLSLALAGGGAGAACTLSTMARPTVTRKGAENVGNKGRAEEWEQGWDEELIPVPGGWCLGGAQRPGGKGVAMARTFRALPGCCPASGEPSGTSLPRWQVSAKQAGEQK